jgi:hypothetical protein
MKSIYVIKITSKDSERILERKIIIKKNKFQIELTITEVL